MSIDERAAGLGDPPRSRAARLRLIGPGLLIAATGIGAGDMITAIVAGTDYGYTLLWVIVLGVAIKFPLSEAIGRWSMATGKSMADGWTSMGRTATWYMIVYLFGATFITSAGLTSVAALATDAMFPGLLPLWAWGVLHGVAAFVLVAFGRYHVFEKIMEVLVGLMFVMAIALAVLLAPDLANLGAGLVPAVPDGSLINILAIVGGIGGVYSLTYYPYWARERGWTRPSWIPIMRGDLTVGYLVEGLFMIAMLVIGVEFLFGSGTAIGDGEGLLALTGPLTERFGPVAGWLFLLGFWAAVTSSILGNWNGASHLFADFVRVLRKVPDDRAEAYLGERSTPFRWFLVWITFPPMLLMALGKPIALVLAFTALGALFFPVLALILFKLLNDPAVPRGQRNRLLSNTLMVAIGLFFVWSAYQAIAGLF